MSAFRFRSLERDLASRFRLGGRLGLKEGNTQPLELVEYQRRRPRFGGVEINRKVLNSAAAGDSINPGLSRPGETSQTRRKRSGGAIGHTDRESIGHAERRCEWDAIAHFTPAVQEMQGRIRQRGLRGAIESWEKQD